MTTKSHLIFNLLLVTIGLGLAPEASGQVRLPTVSRFSQAPQIPARRECPQGATCSYHTSCVASSRAVNRFCMLDNGFTGVCCGRGQTAIGAAPATGTVSSNRINVMRSDGNRFEQTVEQLEDELQRNQLVPPKNTLEFSHQNFFGVNREVLREMQKASQVLQAYIAFAKRENLSPADLATAKFDIRSTNLADVCEVAPSCTNDVLYRNPEGICNNLLHSTLGKAVAAFARLLPPDYADGVNSPRQAKDGGELPNARLVSLAIAPDAPIEDGRYSLMLMQFGQFIDHDLSRTAVVKTHNNREISCCPKKILTNPRLLHPACFVIPVPDQDQFLRSASQACINFVRSAPAINNKCTFGPREQLNQLSAYLDGNNIYGASMNEQNRLRAFRGGQLKVSVIHNEPFLPNNNNASNCQIPKATQLRCFLGGDSRVNEVPDLAVVNGVFLREHNRVATELSRLNPGLNDEVLFQEAKRVVVAEMQHIVYAEFLPLLLGSKSMGHFRLQLVNGFASSYNPAIDASILNEFTTAAYRLHSLIQGNLLMKMADDRTVGTLQLKDTFSNPQVLYQKGAFDMRIAGLVGQPLRHFDNFFHEHITNHLFQIPGKRFGLDLVALDLQRGRDHGLPGYVKYREICGLSPVRSFADLKRHLTNPDVADTMAQLYRSVEDIDLFIAGSSERPLAGAIVGPTFGCIIGEQFRRIKDGDRFWYENEGLETSFTAGQLAEIKKSSLAKMLCDNSGVGQMQRNAFLAPGPRERKVACEQISGIDLSQWTQ